MCCFLASARLNLFGFPGSPAANQNAGFHDIRLVYESSPRTPPLYSDRWLIFKDSVEWVRDNIAGFG
jgi:hypothetical protein